MAPKLHPNNYYTCSAAHRDTRCPKRCEASLDSSAWNVESVWILWDAKNISHYHTLPASFVSVGGWVPGDSTNGPAVLLCRVEVFTHSFSLAHSLSLSSFCTFFGPTLAIRPPLTDAKDLTVLSSGHSDSFSPLQLSLCKLPLLSLPHALPSRQYPGAEH